MSKLKYKVVWTQHAQQDLARTIEYIRFENPLNAKKIFKEISHQAQKLKNFPNRGRVVPELKKEGISQYQELIIKVWRLIYKVFDDKVYVFAMIDSRQNVEDILLRRLS